MAGPTVTATLSARDEATAVFAKFAQSAKNLAKDAEAAFKTAGNGEAFRKIADDSRMASNSVAAAANSIRPNALIMAAAFTALGGAATGTFHRIKEISGAISELTGRMMAYGGATKEVVDATRNMARVEGPRGPGGQEGLMKATYAAQKANLSPEGAKAAGKYGQQFARLMGSSPDDAMEKLIQLTSMGGGFLDDKGKPVTQLDKLSSTQIDKALSTTLGKYIRFAQRLPGKEADIFNFQQYAGPELESLGVKAEVQQAFQLALAQKGITGQHAGVYTRSIFSRAAPTAKGLQAQRSLGIDMMDYVALDKDAMTADHIQAGLEGKFGKFDAKVSKGIKAAVDRFQKDGNAGVLADSLSSQLQTVGVKSLENKAKARKAVQDELSFFVKEYDVIREIRDAKAKGAGVGYFNARFGIEAGTGAKAVGSVAESLPGLIDEFRKELATMNYPKVAQDAEDLYQSTFGAQLNRLSENLKAAFDGLFQPFEKGVTSIISGANHLVEGFNSTSDAVRKLAAEALAAAGVLGLIKGARTAGDFTDRVLRGPAGSGGVAGGAAAGAAAGGAVGGAARAGLRTLWPLAAGWLVGDFLGEADKKGTLWGALEKPNEWIKSLTGIDFSKPPSNAFVGSGWQNFFDTIDTKAARLGGKRKHPVSDALPESWREGETTTFGYSDRATGGKSISPFGPTMPYLPQRIESGELTADRLSQAARNTPPVVIEGEGRLDAEVNVKVETTPDFWARIDRKIQQSTLALRDKRGTTIGGTSGVNPAPTSPAVK